MSAATSRTETPAAVGTEQVIIIGSGPAGYTAAIYAARAGLKPLVLAGAVTAGGALMNTTDVENFPGFPEGIQGPELMDGLQQQAERFGAQVVFDDVTAVQLAGHLKRVVTGAGETHEARPSSSPRGRRTRNWGCRKRKGSAVTASPGAPPATAFSSGTRTSSSWAAGTPRWRKQPS